MSAGVTNHTLNDFLVKSNENLEQIDQNLLALERDPTQIDRIVGIFQSIHSIKESCTALGYLKLKDVADAGENLLSKLSDGKSVLNSDLGTLLLSLSDAVRTMLGTIEQTGMDGNIDWSQFISDLKTASEEHSSLPDSSTSSVERTSPRLEIPPPNDSTPQEMIPQLEVTPVPEVLPEPVLRQHQPVELISATSDIKQTQDVADTNVQVDIGLLDAARDLVGELLATRHRILQTHLSDSTDFQNGFRLDEDERQPVLQANLLSKNDSQLSTETLLLFSIQGGSQIAVPLDAVVRLEEFPFTALETSGLPQAIPYRNDILPLRWLSSLLSERRLRARNPTPLTKLLVVIHALNGRMVGFVVDKILDIVQASICNPRPGSRAGVQGVVVIQGRATELLDVAAIIRTAAFDR